jgi:hypothetical protein
MWQDPAANKADPERTQMGNRSRAAARNAEREKLALRSTAANGGTRC